MLGKKNSLIRPNGVTPAIRKDRKNLTCKMQAWYFQTENNTLAYAIQKGVHGEKKDIPALRRYFICSGEAVYTIDGKEYQATTGSIIEIPAHSTYNFRSIGDKPVKFYVDVGFKLDLDTIPSK